MTKKEFKAAMLRGLGRCVKAVQEKPEKYRDIVLWACARNIAYDTQSEGARSWYVYTLASCYPDQETFISAAVTAIKKYRPNGGWDLLHLSELLCFFAQDGYGFAQQALEEKYQEILASMHSRKRKPNRVFHELSDLEQLGLVLAVDSRSFLRIAEDFGRLYREKRYMDDGDFAWFFASKGRRYRKTMERAAQKNENIACFLGREQAHTEEVERHRQLRKADLQERIIRRKKEKTLPDMKLVEMLLPRMIEAKDWDELHSIGFNIFDAFDAGGGSYRPKHLLPLLYEYNPCSFCRESALAFMGRHRMLTQEMLEECLYDSNEDIRRMAQKRLRK